MKLRAGLRLRSTVCATEVVVVRAPVGDLDLRCGGRPLMPMDTDAPSGETMDPAHQGGTQLGKRYASEAFGVEVLCTKPGTGSLSVGDDPLPLKEAKPLPSSD